MGRRSVAVAVFAACCWLVAGSAKAQPLPTGVFDPYAAPATSGTFYTDVKAAGAGFVRLVLDWKSVAPTSSTASFSAADPADPAYRWGGADAQIEAAVAAGLQPILDVNDAPAWALVAGTADPGTPQAGALGAFMHAAAARYSGTFQGLPRVRYWQVWNEPNLATQLSPQLVDGQPVGAERYRDMVNAVAGAVKSVHADNLVVAGGLAPFRDITPATLAQNKDWGPLTFMRALFCLSPSLQSTCSATVRFDIWSHHPYTSGGPTHHAELPDDVSLGDLPKLRRVLAAARRTGHIQAPAAPRLWVTEFSWDSSPPDPRGVPTALLKRWVPQALYQMWRNGVSLVTWFLLRDQPLSTSYYQSGLYDVSGRPKPYLEGFRFPLVAFPRAHGFYVWGRTPAGTPGTVLVQQRTRGGWRRVRTVTADAAGIFQATLRGAGTGWVRGVLANGQATLPFSLEAVPDRFYNPFGNPTLIESKP